MRDKLFIGFIVLFFLGCAIFTYVALTQPADSDCGISCHTKLQLWK